jgi:hypothetical protein
MLVAFMKTPSKCLKCGAEMREGFILEHRMPARWIAGKPKRSSSGEIKAHGNEQRHIESYCCSGSGYLEFYAGAHVS